MDKAKKLVDDFVVQNKVAVFSKTYCPYCKKAKDILSQYHISEMKIMELDGRPDMDDIQNYLKTLTGARSVPRVFIDSCFIGGGDEVAEKDTSGELKALLKKAGVFA